MAEGSTVIQTVNAVLLVGVLIAATTSTCSVDRLEKQVISLRKKVEAGGVGGGGGGASAVAEEIRRPGDPSPVVVSGWGGRKANVTYVEGAVPNAPLTVRDKPLPQNDTYVNRRGSPPGTLNYYVTNEGETSTITKYIYGRLLGVNLDAPPAVIPELATDWEVSDDKLTYTYHLRRGVQFGDGRPFTSADVHFSFDVMRDPAVEAEHLRGEFADVESMSTPDAHTVVVKYKKKYWKGLYTVGYSLRVLNKGWYEEQIPIWAKRLDIEDFATEPGKPGFGEVFNKIRVPCPGAGPYYIESEDDFQQDHVNLVQNPFYWGIQARPKLWNFLKLKWVFIADAVTAFEAFRKQEFDVTVVDSDRWEDQLRNDETITGIARYFEYDHIGLDSSYIAWNARRSPFDDAKVRTAMTHLMNRQWILDEIERGKGTIAVCKSKRMYPTYSNDLEPHAFDIERAKELLAEAGWTDTDGDGVLDRGGERFEFEFKVPSGRQFYLRVGGALEDACKKAGIRMTVRPLEWSTFIDDFYERRFDAVCLYSSWPDAWIDPHGDYHSSEDRPKGGNTSGWRDTRVDQILDDMRAEFDEEKRTALYHQFNRLFYEGQPETLLVHGIVSVLQNSRFENARVRPTGMQIEDFWVKPENVLHK